MRAASPLYPDLFAKCEGLWLPAMGPDALALDLSGNGRAGSLVAAPSWVSNQFGGAYDFNGTSQYMGMGDVLDFARTDPFTLFACFRTDSLAASFQIVCKANNASPFEGYDVEVATNGSIIFYLFAADATRIRVDTGASVIAAGNYYTIAATYDGSSTTAGMAIYVNGIAQSTTPINTGLTGDTVTTYPFQIGGRNGANTLLNGEVSAAGVWSRVLSPAEIALLAADPVAAGRYEARALEGRPGRRARVAAPATAKPWLWHRGSRAAGRVA